MTHVHSASLIASGLSVSDSGDDTSIRRWIAGSFAFHFLIIIFLTTLRLTPSFEKPLHSYEVSIINLSEFSAPTTKPAAKPAAKTRTKPVKKKPSPSPQPKARPKAKARPPKPKATPLPPLPTQSSTERLSESFSGAVQSVVIPNKLTASAKQPAIDPSDTSAIPTETQHVREPIKLPKSAPKLARANRLTPQPRVSIPDHPTPPTPAPPEKISPNTPQESPTQPKVREETQKALQAIKSPPQAPTLTPIQPFRRTPRKDKPAPTTEKLSETLKKSIQSVKVPAPRRPVAKRKKPTRSTPNRPSTSPTQERVPPDAPQLARVSPSQSQVPPPPVKQERLADSLKHVLDSVKIPQLRHSPTAEPPQEKPSSSTRQNSDLPEQSPATEPSELQSEIEQQLAKLKVPDVVPIESIKNRLQVQAVTTGESSSSSPKSSRSSAGQNRYLALVEAKIDQHWVAPPVSMDQRHMKVMVKFRILRSGEVENLTIKQGSGNAYYDSAAERAVKAASPLPPFPSDLSDSYLDVLYKFSLGELTS